MREYFLTWCTLLCAGALFFHYEGPARNGPVHPSALTPIPRKFESRGQPSPGPERAEAGTPAAGGLCRARVRPRMFPTSWGPCGHGRGPRGARPQANQTQGPPSTAQGNATTFCTTLTEWKSVPARQTARRHKPRPRRRPEKEAEGPSHAGGKEGRRGEGGREGGRGGGRRKRGGRERRPTRSQPRPGPWEQRKQGGQ